jgi:hypothetical protein
MQSTVKAFAATLLLVLLAAPAHAEQRKLVDEYEIHYSVVTTDFLDKEVLAQYGIAPSPNRALLNIAVRTRVPAPMGQAVAAQIEVEAINLVGQMKAIELQEVREADQVYYIGTLPVADEEIVQFSVEVTPQGARHGYRIEFEQQFFVRPE